MKQFATLPTLTAADVFAALVRSLVLIALYLIQQTAHAVRMAYTLSRRAYSFIVARYGEQLGGVAIIAAGLALLYISAVLQSARM